MIIITVYGYAKEMRHQCEEFKKIMEGMLSAVCQDFGLAPKKLQLVCWTKRKGVRLIIKLESIFLKEPPTGFNSAVRQVMQETAKQLGIDASLEAEIVIPKQFQKEI